MSKKLEPDYIKWVATLDSTQAQQEFQKLDKGCGELQKQTNAARKAMAELEAQGEKGWYGIGKPKRGCPMRPSLFASLR